MTYLKTVVNILQHNFEINLALHSIWGTNSVSSWITCYLLQTDTKYIFFAWSQIVWDCNIVTYPPLHINLSWDYVCAVWFLSIFVTLFHIGRIPNENPQMPYLVLDAIKTSLIISYHSTSTNLIWVSWKIIEESYFFCWI